ncbi:hypothetical protein M9458_019548, partial [Cirrhinus mrigala]
ILNELDEAYEKHRQESDPAQRRRLLHCIQRSLIHTEELGDEKIQIAGQMVEMVENRSRQLEWQSELFQACQDSPESTVAVTPVTMTPVSASMLSVSKPSVDRRRDETPTSVDKSGGKRSRRQKNGSENRENSSYGLEHNEETSSTSSKKKKRSKSKQDREPSPTDLPIDPNEPTYCLCEQVSYGEMIGCDNDECTIEWFHFSCVGLHHKPKGKWYCPKCRGDNEKTMDKALERSKKERAYNR